MKLGIVVIGYNRAKSMNRLLNRLKQCYYDEEVLLIISIDNSGNDFVEKVAESFEWPNGKKIIKTFTERLGLRKHVLTCGAYLNEFDLDAIAVFEDDVFPALDFYGFMKQSVAYYKNDNNIAGISLYTHLWNMHAKLPFQPRYSGYDVYFMQFPQSWGQIWLRDQWEEFYKWYLTNSDEFNDIAYIPRNVCEWGNNSWLKYHIRYCIEKNKYFVYPYISLSTCLSEVGEHISNKTEVYQVPILEGKGKKYNFVDFSDSALRYDAYFENENIKNLFTKGTVCVDLYGEKKNNFSAKYWLTTKRSNYKIIKSFAFSFKPHEMNIIENISGGSIYLYDTTKIEDDSRIKSERLLNLQYYSRMEISVVDIIKILLLKLKRKLNKLKNIIIR